MSAEEVRESEQSADTARLTSKRTLSRNMVLNLLGMGLPTLLALAAIPLLIHLMGEQRFGVLLLAWLVFGYFSIFDLGLNRALTQLVSRALGEGRSQDVAPLFWTALLLMFVAGTVGGLVVGLLARPLVYEWLRVPEGLQNETYWAFMVMAGSLPMLVSASALQGFLQAHQRFGMVFIVQMWRGVWTFAGPLLVVGLFTTNLTVVVLGLLLGRIVAWVLSMELCRRAQPSLTRRIWASAPFIRPLLTYGGWMALGSAVVPIVLYGDRMLIGVLLSMEAVTYYTTPAEIVVKLLLVPQAVVTVLFPAFAATYRTDLEKTKRLFRLGLKLVYLSFFPIAVLGVALAPEALRLWLGGSFEQRSSIVLQLLIIGVFLNGSGILLSALVQAMGRPSITAIVYCVELPVFGVLMWLLTRQYGIEGTAAVWAMRQGVDALVLLLFARALLRDRFSMLARQILMAVGAVLALGVVMSLDGLASRLVLGGGLVGVLAVVGWKAMFTESERGALKVLLNRRSAEGP